MRRIEMQDSNPILFGAFLQHLEIDLESTVAKKILDEVGLIER
jgi:hypothetical protein